MRKGVISVLLTILTLLASFRFLAVFTILGSLNTFYSYYNCYAFDMLTLFVNLDNFYTFNNTEISKVLWDLLMYLKN